MLSIADEIAHDTHHVGTRAGTDTPNHSIAPVVSVGGLRRAHITEEGICRDFRNIQFTGVW